MHECPACGDACDCDMEDHDQGAPDTCSHACDDDLDDDDMHSFNDSDLDD